MASWYDSISGLFDSGSSANNSIMSAVNAGASADTIANMGKSFTDAGAYDSGLLGSIGGGVSDAMGWLGDNQKTLEGAGTLLQAGGGLYDALINKPKALEQEAQYRQGLLNATNKQIALAEQERQRQIDKEIMANQAMSSGFDASGLGLYNEKKKNQTLVDTGRNVENSNYYGV